LLQLRGQLADDIETGYTDELGHLLDRHLGVAPHDGLADHHDPAGATAEVAKIIYVLCTETSSYVNGAEIHINGGQHV
jgi:hypothetical protein